MYCDGKMIAVNYFFGFLLRVDYEVEEDAVARTYNANGGEQERIYIYITGKKTGGKETTRKTKA
jgi:hypothetical protein